FTNRDQRASESGVDDVVDDNNRQNGNQKDPEETLDDWDPGVTACAADSLDVVEKDDNDLTKTECDDREIVAFQTQLRNTNCESCDSGDNRTHDRGDCQCH